jgi:hypothetical protein|tara:strand:- start:40 stop:306 length:267 start_codon:yes stop_codon:yes gene_type:complete
MLDNGLFFSLIISGFSTGLIYLLTNRNTYTNESNYDSKELLKVFSIIFTICLSVNYLKNSSFSGNNTPAAYGSMRSGEYDTQSSRPPF